MITLFQNIDIYVLFCATIEKNISWISSWNQETSSSLKYFLFFSVSFPSITIFILWAGNFDDAGQKNIVIFR